MKRMAILVPVLLALAFACKPVGKDANGAKATTPKRVGGDGDAAAAGKVGVLGEGGGKSLYMDLAKVPDAREASSLSYCFTMPADDVAVGRAVCKKDPQKSLEITAANVDFVCTGSASFGTVKARRPVSLDFCASYDVFAYKFEPAFNVKIAN